MTLMVIDNLQNEIEQQRTLDALHCRDLARLLKFRNRPRAAKFSAVLGGYTICGTPVHP